MTDLFNALTLLANYVIVPALSYGSQLGLGALGVTLIYGILRFSNFAHGDTMAFGTMVTILLTWLAQSMGVTIYPLPTAILVLPIGIAVTILMVLAIDKTVYAHFRKVRASPVIFIMASVGVMFVLQGIIRLIIGPDDQLFADGARFLVRAKEFKATFGLNEGLSIRISQLVTIIFTIILATLLFWFLHNTRTGKSMRAYSDNNELAQLSGINPDRVIMLTWIIAATLATVAGVLFGLDKSFRPFLFFQLLLPIFAAAIVGGLGNPLGAFVGGYIVAFSEITLTYAYKRFFIYILPESMEPSSLVQLLGTEYKIAVSFFILVLVLLIKPTGIFGERTT
ncbi:MAG: branched-chain amino acid ABC transporter permease [Rhodobacteraceae bacterium]|nr:branched-chain amino acid ABC transporter permease [Paracoccaceae bacterium]